MKDRLAPDPHVIVVVGATGDLAREKLIPALYHLAVDGLLPERYRIVGSAGTQLDNDGFGSVVRDSVKQYCACHPEGASWKQFSESLSYVAGRLEPGNMEELQREVAEAEDELGGASRRLFYLAVPPSAFGTITKGIGQVGLNERANIVYEKPFGSDLRSARELNEVVHEVFDEAQVYRIDHFLGKETVQNILAFRFANGMFEPIWNRNFVDHVQIDVPETVGIEKRAAFYEQTGALRDMLVTHLFQVLSFVAMEPPATFDPPALIAEKVKVFKSIVPLQPQDVVRGQFDGYQDVQGVDPASETETFVAAKLYVDNWRWAGVPFFLRTGKAMAEKRSTVTIAFAEPPRQLFPDAQLEGFEPDHLTLELGPREGVSLAFMAKMPGFALQLGRAKMEFKYQGSFGSEFIQAYERLLHDALVGDRTLFLDAEGIEETWEAVAAVLADPPELHAYPHGSWGPKEAEALIRPRGWHLPE
ncbi:MAG: glucose-6-phosphate dehydrogenase [Acidimicrobiia bacterium]